MTVADRIRGLMAAQGISVTAISKLFKVSRRTWANWMGDPETQLNIGKVRVIAAYLHTTPAALIGEEGA